jgi:alanine dehydrogenase
MVSSMKKGACIVDISIDQGGASETSRATTHKDPYYLENGVVHYCVSNIPAAVPLTSTMALTSATLPFISLIALEGVVEVIKNSSSLSLGLNTFHGKVTCRGVAESLGKEYSPPGDLV